MTSVPAPGAKHPLSPAPRAHWRRPLIAYVVVVLSLAALGYVAYLDHTVRSQFEPNRRNIAFAGLLGGAILGASWAFLKGRKTPNGSGTPAAAPQ